MEYREGELVESVDVGSTETRSRTGQHQNSEQGAHQRAAPCWEQFVRESLMQAAWPIALQPPFPRRALTVDHQSSASELITRRGVFSRRQYGSVEQLSSAADGIGDTIRRFRLENGNTLGEKDELFGPPNAPVLENPEFQTRWYFKYFLGKLHQNYIGVDSYREPYILSVVQDTSTNLLRAILFNKMGAHKISLPASAWNTSGTSDKIPPVRPSIKQILVLFPNMERLDKAPREITSPELQKDVLLLEEQEGSVNFKIGVILMKPGQRTDDEILSNENGDQKWERFLSILGEQIRLRGWNRFRGGLDVKGDMTGSHSVYTMHQGHEIMFHVSTMLPFSKDNKQQLERKRHIGNDIVNIIFTDDESHHTFNPSCVKSHFTHIFAVVSETRDGYRLSVFTDEAVPPFGPSLPCPPVFQDAKLFRDFLLVKLMNGEKAAFRTPTFALKRQRTLDTLIRDIYTEHCIDHKPMLSRRALSDVWSSSGVGSAGGGAVSTDRFLHLGQALKLEAVLKGDAPTSLASAGSGGQRKVPWEGKIWRSAPLPHAPVCAVTLNDGRLILATTQNTYLLEECGTTRVVLRWEGCVLGARVTERTGVFRCGCRTTNYGLYALPLQQLITGAWAMRPLQDCKQQRIQKTKGSQCFDVIETEAGQTLVAVCVGKRISVLNQEIKADHTGDGLEFTQLKEIQVSEAPILVKLLDNEVGALVVGYKHHWEMLDHNNGQPIKRVDSEGKLDESMMSRRGTLVNVLQIRDDKEAQFVFCYNHTCHFERLTCRGLENDREYDFHWTTVPTSIVCAFPYIMAFAEDLLEIRLVANGSLVHAACIPGLKLLCGENDIFYVACAPEYVPLCRDATIQEPHKQYNNTENTFESVVRQFGKQCITNTMDDDETFDITYTTETKCSDNNSASSRSSSLSSEQENIRPPLQRMTAISPPTSPQVMDSNGRCVRIYRIPRCNLSAAAYQRQSISADHVLASCLPNRPSSFKQQRVTDVKLEISSSTSIQRDNDSFL